ncbi:MAG: acyltransferase [Flavobacteriaceae bacterium]
MKTWLISFIAKYYQRFRVRLYKQLSNNNHIKGSPKHKSPVLYKGKGEIQFREGVILGYNPSPFFYNSVIYLEARNEDAVINIGNNTIANNALSIIADKGLISIGNDVLIGSEVFIINSNFHGIHPLERNTGTHECEDVIIENNVFIGSRVTILKGVKIGENSIVASGSVVTKKFPKNVIIGGNPAQIIKEIDFE